MPQQQRCDFVIYRMVHLARTTRLLVVAPMPSGNSILGSAAPPQFSATSLI